MPMITRQEFYTLRLYELDDIVYRRIESAFRRILGHKTERFMLKHLQTKLLDVACSSCVDITGCFVLL